MNPTHKTPKAGPLPGRWWLVWLAVTILAAVIPVCHVKWHVAEIIEPLRYPWGLMPVHWLIFRWLGEFSVLLLLGVLIAGGYAWYRPEKGRLAIVQAAVLSLAFTVCYGFCCGFAVVGFIKAEAQAAAMKRAKPEMRPHAPAAENHGPPR